MGFTTLARTFLTRNKHHGRSRATVYTRYAAVFPANRCTGARHGYASTASPSPPSFAASPGPCHPSATPWTTSFVIRLRSPIYVAKTASYGSPLPPSAAPSHTGRQPGAIPFSLCCPPWPEPCTNYYTSCPESTTTSYIRDLHSRR